MFHKPIQNKGTKHIDLAYDFARERFQQQEGMCPQSTMWQITNPLQPERFLCLLRMFG